MHLAPLETEIRHSFVPIGTENFDSRQIYTPPGMGRLVVALERLESPSGPGNRRLGFIGTKGQGDPLDYVGNKLATAGIAATAFLELEDLVTLAGSRLGGVVAALGYDVEHSMADGGEVIAATMPYGADSVNEAFSGLDISGREVMTFGGSNYKAVDCTSALADREHLIGKGGYPEIHDHITHVLPLALAAPEVLDVLQADAATGTAHYQEALAAYEAEEHSPTEKTFNALTAAHQEIKDLTRKYDYVLPHLAAAVAEDKPSMLRINSGLTNLVGLHRVEMVDDLARATLSWSDTLLKRAGEQATLSIRVG